MAEENGEELPPPPAEAPRKTDEEKPREKDRDRERDREKDKDRERSRGRDRSDRDKDRKHSRSVRSRSRDKKHSRRSRSRSRDRDRKSRRHRSRSRSRSRRRSYSRDRSAEPRRRRKTGFDQGPPAGMATGFGAAPAAPGLPQSGFGAAPSSAGMQALAGANPLAAAGLGLGAAGLAGIAGLPGMAGMANLPGMGNIPGLPNMPGLAGLQAAGLLGGAQSSAPPSQQATRHARRVYVGGLPTTSTEQGITEFFSNALNAIGGVTAGPAGSAVVNVYLNAEKKFAFVEFRTVEETSNAMALDGIMYEGVSVRVRRPNDYNPAAAASLGPSVPNPGLNLAAIGLTPGGAQAQSAQGAQGAADTGERVFVGGLPYYLTEEQIRELLSTFGAIKTFDLVKDRDTGQSKGYGFVVYAEPSVTDIACAGLHGMKMGDRTLTVRRANSESGRSEQQAAGIQLPPPPLAVPGALPGAVPGLVPAAPTRIVVLEHAVTMEELLSDEEYADIMEDMREEAGKYGAMLNVVIPRPAAPPGSAPNPPGVGKVIIEYEAPDQAAAARNAMHGRKFGGRVVIGTYISEEKYASGQYD